jgi:hypothetical protein
MLTVIDIQLQVKREQYEQQIYISEGWGDILDKILPDPT